MAHTDQPVPLLVSGPGVASDAVSTFGERAVRAGALGALAGVEIVPGLIDFIRP
jgi:2,3-bisphosphoglycerate-independent phosphoglycerate mutase